MQNTSKVAAVNKIICLCMCCKDYRDQYGQWGDLPSALQTTEVRVSHGICPDCLKRVYGREPVSRHTDSAR